jgi:dynein heavy chain
MRNIKENPSIKKISDDNISLRKMKENNRVFEQIRKALDEFLEKKRTNFQRFFFLSNDELLEILSVAKELKTLQPFLSKVFENIHAFEFDKENISGVLSAEGEKLEFRHFALRPGQNEVEDWLRLIEEQMRASLKHTLKTCIHKYEYEDIQRTSWIF